MSGQRFSTVGMLSAAAFTVLMAGSTGCKGCKGSGEPGDAAAAEDGEEAGTSVAITSGDLGDGGSAAGLAHPEVAALVSPAPVFSATEFPPKDPTKATEERQGVTRLGYLRKGARVAVKPNIIKKSSCAEGWFELVSGGYICGKFATLDMGHKELAKAPHPPLADSPLPYQYGMNLTNGTPLYRRNPLKKERAESEKALQVGKSPPAGSAKERPQVAPDANGEVPWYLRTQKGQKPNVSLDELKEGGLVVMRMVRGFYVAIDTEVHAFSGKFWRTTDGLLAPADHILVHKPKTEFEGITFGPESKHHLPLGFALGTHTHRYTIDEPDKPDTPDKKARRSAETVPRFTFLQLTGKRTAVDNKNFYETDEGWWLRSVDGAHTNPGPAPTDLAPGEKWIDVNLSTQTLVAYEGDKPFFATLVSSGRHDDNDKSKDHRTVSGSFRIREKHVSATMDDDGAGDGTYSIQDVPWIMYFQGSFALHGAFWHASFGRERSHGCVNLQPADAKKIFNWVGPTLPPGWHGVKATEANPGTRVIVHE